MSRQPILQALARRNPFFRDLPTSLFFNDVDNLWSDQFNETGDLNLYEENNNLIVEVELPGLRPEEIEITYNKGVLNIRGEQKREEKEGKEGKNNRKYYRQSRRSFSYCVALPLAVDESKEPQASYNDGIMKITFQKAQQDSLRRITVKAS